MNAVHQLNYFIEEEKSFFKTLLYFDIFSYPLTAKEIAQYSSVVFNSSPEQVLEFWVSQKVVFQIQGFYSLQNKFDLVERRLKGNLLAGQKMKTAKKVSWFLHRLPFVRAVMLSGSISKGFMDEKSDIDYFIITEANRLWLVRTLLAIFRRVFLFNSHKNLCTNYFVDTQNLEIAEKNIFTATELCTLKPMCGKAFIENFLSANGWTTSFLPLHQTPTIYEVDSPSIIKNLGEKIFPSRFLDRVNRWLMKKTLSYWKKKYGKEMNANDFEVAFRSTVGVSKSHPQFFQKKVLSRLDQKIKEFEIRNGIDLSL